MARLTIDEDGGVRLPDALLDALGVSPGRALEARVEKGRLVLTPLPRDTDPFEDGVKGPDAAGFEKALLRDAEEKAKAREAFDRAMREKHDIDIEREQEERDRWR